MRGPSRLVSVFVCLCFLFLAKPASAQPCNATQPGYVSDVTQILCIETSTVPGAMTGQITVLVTDSTSNFGDVAAGPDGRLYFTDSKQGRVFSFDLTNGGNPPLVATIPDTNVNGLSFASSNGLNNGDLYVTAHTGVWLVPHVACANCSAGVPIEAITFAAPITAGGNAFDLFSTGENETQVIVDQTHGQILQSSFTVPFSNNSNFGGFNSATVLANVSKLGQGVFGDFCGDTLVASGTTIQRLSFSFKNGKLVVTPSTYVNLGDTVQYFEVAANNTVVAATFSNGAGGIVWSVQPQLVAGGGGVPSCTATPTVIKVVSLKTALRSNPNLLADMANGVALGPTSITVTQSFSVGQNQTQIYNFGPTELKVTYENVLQPFSQSFTAFRSLPADILFCTSLQQAGCAGALTLFHPDTVPIHPSQLGGFAVQYVTPTAGVGAAPQNCNQNAGNPQYGPCPPDTLAIQMESSYSTQDFLNDPGTAGTDGFVAPNVPVTYTDDATHDVWGADAGTSNGTNTKQWGSGFGYVDDDQPLKQNLTVTVQSPVASCQINNTTPTCNPQFNIGQSVTFKITFSPSPTLAPIARLSIAKVEVRADGTIQLDQTIDVFSKNNSQTDNFFSCSASLNQCNYNWDSSGAAGAGPGLYQATIFSDSFAPPVLVYMTMKTSKTN